MSKYKFNINGLSKVNPGAFVIATFTDKVLVGKLQIDCEIVFAEDCDLINLLELVAFDGEKQVQYIKTEKNKNCDGCLPGKLTYIRTGEDKNNYFKNIIFLKGQEIDKNKKTEGFVWLKENESSYALPVEMETFKPYVIVLREYYKFDNNNVLVNDGTFYETIQEYVEEEK